MTQNRHQADSLHVDHSRFVEVGAVILRGEHLFLMMTLVLIGVLAVSHRVSAAGGAPREVGSGGVVAGTVRLEGPAPKPAHISMAIDSACATSHPGGATAEDVVITSSGGLANVIVYVSEGLPERSIEPTKQDAIIEQKGCMYEPHVLAVLVNQKVHIVNADQTTHNIHPIPQNNREWNKSEPPGVTPLEESFPRPEIAIPVKCNIHPWMKGYIAVFKHSYFAVTGKDGSFDIRNLPAGTYTLQAWHEKFGTLSKTISIAGGNSDKVEFVFRSKN